MVELTWNTASDWDNAQSQNNVAHADDTVHLESSWVTDFEHTGDFSLGNENAIMTWTAIDDYSGDLRVWCVNQTDGFDHNSSYEVKQLDSNLNVEEQIASGSWSAGDQHFTLNNVEIVDGKIYCFSVEQGGYWARDNTTYNSDLFNFRGGDVGSDCTIDDPEYYRVLGRIDYKNLSSNGTLTTSAKSA